MLQCHHYLSIALKVKIRILKIILCSVFNECKLTKTSRHKLMWQTHVTQLFHHIEDFLSKCPTSDSVFSVIAQYCSLANYTAVSCSNQDESIWKHGSIEHMRHKTAYVEFYQCFSNKNVLTYIDHQYNHQS